MAEATQFTSYYDNDDTNSLGHFSTENKLPANKKQKF